MLCRDLIYGRESPTRLNQLPDDGSIAIKIANSALPRSLCPFRPCDSARLPPVEPWTPSPVGLAYRGSRPALPGGCDTSSHIRAAQQTRGLGTPGFWLIDTKYLKNTLSATIGRPVYTKPVLLAMEAINVASPTPSHQRRSSSQSRSAPRPRQLPGSAVSDIARSSEGRRN